MTEILARLAGARSAGGEGPIVVRPAPRDAVAVRPGPLGRVRPLASRWGRRLATERPRPLRIRERPGAHWLAVLTVCFGAFMGQLDASIVTVALPAMGTDLHANLAVVQWVVLAYLVTLVTLLAPTGRLSDAAGRKLVYGYGFAVFTAASAVCAWTPGLGPLVVARVVQAVGAAMLQANSVALIATSVPRRSLTRALGVQGAAQACGLALGPPLGGVLVATVGWRWIFWINVPVGAVALVAGRYLLPRTRERAGTRGGLDWPGLLLLAVTVTALLLGLSGLSGAGGGAWQLATLFPVAACGAVAFSVRETRAGDPIVPPWLLRSPRVARGLVGAFCSYLVLFATLVVVPLTARSVGQSTELAGLVLAALPAGFAVGAVCSGLLPAGVGAAVRARVGMGAAVAALVVTWAGAFTPAVLAPELLLLGLGLGTFTAPNNASVMGAVPAGRSGVAGGLVNMTRSVGTAFGVALVGLALHASGHGLAGYRTAVAALASVALVALVTVPPDHPADPP